jgi:hypothetical protein
MAVVTRPMPPRFTREQWALVEILLEQSPIVADTSEGVLAGSMMARDVREIIEAIHAYTHPGEEQES